MARATMQSKVEKRGARILRLTEKVPRFKHSRQAKALIDAIRRRDSDLAMWFLKHGFPAEAKDNKGRSAIWWAAMGCLAPVIRELVKRGIALPDDALVGPVDWGDLQTVRYLIRQGANVDCVASVYSPVPWHNQKDVLLKLAIMCLRTSPQREDIPVALVRGGAKIDRRCKQSPASLLGLAALFQLTKTVKAMIARGADVNIRDGWGRTPLFNAVLTGNVAIAKALVRAGARTDVKDRSGMTLREAMLRQKESPTMVHTGALITGGLNIDPARVVREQEEWQQQKSELLALIDRSSGRISQRRGKTAGRAK
jgi:ankyrin repeat protein